MKKIVAVLIILSMLIFAGCTTKQEEPKIATLAGPTGMGMVQLIDSGDYDIDVYTSPDQIVPKIINGEVDIASVPSNLASVLYNKTEGNIQILSTNTLGVLYIVENGNSINSIEDLAGKTIYATGQGASPEYILNKILAENNLETVTVEYMGAHGDLAAKVAAGDVEIALLPEPFVSTTLMKNQDIRICINLDDEWQKLFGEGISMPMGVTIVNNDYLLENDKKVEEFMTDYQNSVDFVNSSPEEASQMMVDNAIIGNIGIAKAVIPNCQISMITDEESMTMLKQYLSVLFDSDPTSVGGKLPNDDIYYMD